MVNSVLQVVTMILPLAACLVYIFSSWRRKRISIEILSDSIISLNDELSEEMQVSTREHPLKQVRLVVTRIRKSGNVTIQSDDYLQPIRLKFGGTILRSTVVEETPADTIVADLEVNKDFLAFPKVSLHPRNSVTISTVLSDERKGITIDGRIADGQVSISKTKGTGKLILSTLLSPAPMIARATWRS